MATASIICLWVALLATWAGTKIDRRLIDAQRRLIAAQRNENKAQQELIEALVESHMRGFKP